MEFKLMSCMKKSYGDAEVRNVPWKPASYNEFDSVQENCLDPYNDFGSDTWNSIHAEEHAIQLFLKGDIINMRLVEKFSEGFLTVFAVVDKVICKPKGRGAFSEN